MTAGWTAIPSWKLKIKTVQVSEKDKFGFFFFWLAAQTFINLEENYLHDLDEEILTNSTIKRTRLHYQGRGKSILCGK